MALCRTSLASVQASSTVYCHAMTNSNAIPSAWTAVPSSISISHCSALQSKEFVADVAVRGGEKVRLLSCRGLVWHVGWALLLAACWTFMHQAAEPKPLVDSSWPDRDKRHMVLRSGNLARECATNLDSEACRGRAALSFSAGQSGKQAASWQLYMSSSWLPGHSTSANQAVSGKHMLP